MGSENVFDLLHGSPTQDLVDILINACSKLGDGGSQELRRQLCRSASICLETYYRTNAGVPNGQLTVEDFARMAETIACGGKTRNRAAMAHDGRIRLRHVHCPLKDYTASDRAALCRAASSLLGDIAARNFDYAKVSIRKDPCPRGTRGCEFSVLLRPDRNDTDPGDEYFPDRTVSPTVDSLPCQSASSTETGSTPDPSTPGIVAYSSAISQLLQAVDIIAPTSATVLITGETGVGKELVARRLHAVSDRATQDFVAVNCGAIPEELADSALFGHEKGAFTGARERHKGYFERAKGSTLFLDEINSLPLSTQGRLLRVLQEGEFERVGGTQIIHTDARIIASTNSSLEEAVARGEFRQDLWFRINVIDLHVPPLRESKESIPVLVEHILVKLRSKYPNQVQAVSDRAMRQLYDHAWPGNVRELENVLERSYLFTQGKVMERIHLNGREATTPRTVSSTESTHQGWHDYKHRLIEQAERTFLVQSLEQYAGDLDRVANQMDLSKRSIYLKMCRYGLDPNHYRR